MTYVKLHTEFTTQIRENIIFKVINRTKHQELLKKIPHNSSKALQPYGRNLSPRAS